MATYYANSRFKKSVNEWGRVEEWVEPGDKVSQSDLKVDDDTWKSYIERGIVVEDYPDNLGTQKAPAEYYRENPRESTVDESTPSEEAMGKLDTADERGEKLPGADEGNGEKKPGWMNK